MTLDKERYEVINTKEAREDAELSHVWPLNAKSWIKTLADKVDCLREKHEALLTAADDVVSNPVEYMPMGDIENARRLRVLREQVAACKEAR